MYIVTWVENDQVQDRGFKTPSERDTFISNLKEEGIESDWYSDEEAKEENR
ncbi:hypothetical protein TCA2_4628 [Paenibacillus sp. TCA20]|uniref:Uncharacterized protein n=1 Tax=Paenibacillus urinalis TaxID=521520 RepID=A0ABY7XHF6_9BACL|nr:MULTISPECIES: hypothetical protein [Paenibacillus]WDI05038.1 hypothetical protein PUW25_26070 [Paenibacillus urinalis]GAK42136.1 hypothetical protein TCA2_4628 [Paenibacillus sp. TCA20]